jgi:hypothetical protein
MGVDRKLPVAAGNLPAPIRGVKQRNERAA